MGISESGVKRYASGETPVSTPVAQLITLVLQRKITVDDIRKTGQSPFISSKWEEDDLYRRLDRGSR